MKSHKTPPAQTCCRPSGWELVRVLGVAWGGVSVLTGVTQEGSQTVAMVVYGQGCSTGIRQIRYPRMCEI